MSASRTKRKPVAIIGAGFAGLVAARRLHERGVPFQVYEGSNRIGGLAQSYRDEQGFHYDCGAHFITNRLARAIGVERECREVAHYGEAVFLDGRSYAYPTGLMTSPRFAWSGLQARCRKVFGRDEPLQSAAAWFRAEVGTRLADEVAIPLLESWSGMPAEELAPAVCDKLPGSIARTVMLKLAGVLTGRPIAVGYCRELPETPSVWHVYPLRGIETLCRKLAGGIEDSICLDSRIDQINVRNNRVTSIQLNGKEQHVSGVFSTAPVNALPALVRGTDALRPLARFRYRPMLFVNLCLRGRNFLPDVVTWTPGHRFPFFRLTESPQAMPWLAPPGKTIITADIGCNRDDPNWHKSDAELAELCLQGMAPLIPDCREQYLGCRVIRTPCAYPVFANSYELERQAFARSTGIKGLQSIGRNGEFAHILMEDVYCRTLRKVDAFVDELEESETLEPSNDRAELSFMQKGALQETGIAVA